MNSRHGQLRTLNDRMRVRMLTGWVHKIMTSRNLYRGRSRASTSVATLLRMPCSRAFEQVRRVQVRHAVTPGYADGDTEPALKRPGFSRFPRSEQPRHRSLGSV